MIARQEIFRIAKKTGVHPETVEREYVNGIFIDAISYILDKNDFSVHGGTCRNKAYNGLPGTYDEKEINGYFSKNRFSMDIDSYISSKMNNERRIGIIVSKCRKLILDGFDIDLDPKNIKIRQSWRGVRNKVKLPCVDVFIPYFGPMYNSKFAPPRIKLSLDSNESPILNPLRTMVYHPFSDHCCHDLIGNFLSYPELLGRKMFALYNRKLGKDLYDIAIIFDKYDLTDHFDEINMVIEKKKRMWEAAELPKTLRGYRSILKKSWDATIPKTVEEPMEFDRAYKNLEIVFNMTKNNKSY
jgi:predicted nucleotidyltransferase component of viral defense system